MSSWPRSPLTLLSLALALAACEPEPAAPADLDVDGALFALVQTTDGVSFYMPLGPEPVAAHWAFDPTLLSALRVELESTGAAGDVRTEGVFSEQTDPRLVLLAAHELYFVNVPASAYFTDPSRSYRFLVYRDGVEIGRSDMTDHVFTVLRWVPALKVGVKLRIEQRGCDPSGPAPSLDWLPMDGASMWGRPDLGGRFGAPTRWGEQPWDASGNLDSSGLYCSPLLADIQGGFGPTLVVDGVPFVSPDQFCGGTLEVSVGRGMSPADGSGAQIVLGALTEDQSAWSFAGATSWAAVSGPARSVNGTSYVEGEPWFCSSVGGSGYYYDGSWILTLTVRRNGTASSTSLEIISSGY